MAALETAGADLSDALLATAKISRWKRVPQEPGCSEGLPSQQLLEGKLPSSK